MTIEQIYTGCLAQGAYFIESNGEAAIIDPLREVSSYIQKAEELDARIKYIFETHFHADFVSGHVTLSERTKAPIVFGPNADPKFEAHIAEDGEVFKIGDVTLTVLHTPGHTMESTCYLLKDENGKDHALFSGDTLFLGDVGRPDLAQKSESMTQEYLAGLLYKSLRSKIMPLSDDIIVYPAHGAGSACGKNMMKETVDTLGNQKKMNYALRSDMTEGEFIEEVLDGLMPPPAYFPANVRLNKEGYADVAEIKIKSKKEYSPEDFEELANHSSAVVLDIRHQSEYVKSHIPRSIFIGLNGSFAPWVGELIKDINQPILLVAGEEQIDEAITRLSRVGFDNVLGYLKRGISNWISEGKSVDSIDSINANEMEKRLHNKSIPIVDVRKEGEYSAEHVEDALSFPLSKINEHLNELPKDNFFIHCAGGYRSVIAASILKSRGHHNLIDIAGGFDAIKQTKIPTTEFVCPTTL